MGLARVDSAVVVGVQAHVVQVEAHAAAGLPGMSLVGLPDTAVNESRDRVRAAIVNSGLRWPGNRLTVGLSPAWLPKRGPGLDLAIALAVLAADGQLPSDALTRVLALGELGLDGTVRPVAGALAAALAVRGGRADRVVTGPADARQISLVPGLRVLASKSLRSAVAELRGEPEIDDPCDADDDEDRSPLSLGGIDVSPVDLAAVKGQPQAKRALEIAAAGGHHIALLGRAGVGKTLIAERLPDLLPDLDESAALEVTAIHQLAGQVGRGVIARPPYRAPHHTASRVAMVGGGSDARPTIGVVSLAHRGVLFLDEAAEFEPNVLDALREPLDSGSVTVARAGFQVVLPANVQAILATNPCPCGNALDVRGPASCRCTSGQRRRYLGRISGPLMDRIDLRVVLSRPTLAELRAEGSSGGTTAAAARRVAAAREAAARRLRGSGASCTREAPTDFIERNWKLPAPVRNALDRACGRESLRGRDRVARVAWTIADLAGRDEPSVDDLDEAVELRAVDESWAAS